MATKRLIGKDGKISKAVKGAEITATTALAKGYYVATAIAASSGLPVGLQVGYIFYAGDITGKIITPKTGDKEIKLTFTELCDIKSASLEFSKDEIDVTTLCDAIKTYRSGFSDATGSLEGVTTIGITESLIGKFIDTVSQSADLATVTITEANGDPLFLVIEVNSTSTNDEATALYIAPITLLGYSASAAVEGDQAFTSNFRITPDDEIKAAFFELAAV